MKSSQQHEPDEANARDNKAAKKELTTMVDLLTNTVTTLRKRKRIKTTTK